jgi:hypothetical protein
MLKTPPRCAQSCVQDVFALPNHLALVTEWANCGDLKSYITSYTQDNVRCSPIPRHLCCQHAPKFQYVQPLLYCDLTLSGLASCAAN